MTSQKNPSWNKAISVLCLTLFLHCHAGKGLQDGWSPKHLQTTAGPSLGHSSIRLQGPCACGQKENLQSCCYSTLTCLTLEFWDFLINSFTQNCPPHTHFHKTVLISWQMAKLKRQWLHLFLHFHLHHHCLQNLGLCKASNFKGTITELPAALSKELQFLSFYGT